MVSNWLKAGVIIGAIWCVGSAAFAYSAMNPAPGCTDDRVKPLVVSILKDKLHLAAEGDLSLTHIRRTVGTRFGIGYTCQAEISGIKPTDTLAGMRFNTVEYTTNVTLNEPNIYVTARLVPYAE